MTKKYFFVLFLISLFSAFNAQAQLKVDAAQVGNGVLGDITEVVDSVIKDVNTASEYFEQNQIGTPIQSGYEKLKAMKSRIEEQVAAGKEKYEEVSGLLNPETYEEKIEGLKNNQAVSTVTLGSQIKELDKQMEDRKKVIDEELEGKIKAASENLVVLQEGLNTETDELLKAALADEIAQTQDVLDGYVQEQEDAKQDPDSYYSNDEEYQTLKEKRNEKQVALDVAKAALITAATGLGAALLAGIIKRSSAEKTALYEDLNKNNFISPDEPITQSSIDRVENERWKNYKEDIAHAYVALMKYRAKHNQLLEDSDNTAYNVGASEHLESAEGLENQHIIDNMLINQEVMRLGIAQLRLKTSENIVVQGYTLHNPSKNPGEINLDNYEYKKEDIENGLGSKDGG